MKFCKLSAVPSVFATILSVLSPDIAARAEEFYSGKTITILVSSNPGGQYDTYSRLLARHLSKHIAGAPSVVVQNDGGGGGLRGAQQIYALAPKDGTRIGSLRAINMLNATLKIRGGEIDPTRYEWLGNITGDADVCAFWHTSGIRTIEDLRAKETLVGASGHGSLGYNFPSAMNYALETRMKIITGYKGVADRILAMQQGEIQGACGMYASQLTSMYPQLLSAGQLIPVSQSGLRPFPALSKVPLGQSFARTETQKRILVSLFSVPDLAYPFAAPPGTPKDRVEILRQAFEKALADPDLVAEARKAKLVINPTPGEEVAKIMAEMSDLSPELQAEIRAAIGN